MKDIGIKSEKLEKQIDKVCDSAIHFLIADKKDSAGTYGLIKIFKEQKKGYQSQLLNESEMVFMSYGKFDMIIQSEKDASAGYYYLALKEKYKFLKAMYDNTKENLDPSSIIK